MLGRILVMAGAGMSAVLTLVAMIITMVNDEARNRAALYGQTLDQILFVLGSVILIALAAGAVVMVITGAGKLSTTGLLKGLGLALAAIVYFSGWAGIGGVGVKFGIWWFYILLGDLLIYVGAVTMEGQLLATKPAEE